MNNLNDLGAVLGERMGGTMAELRRRQSTPIGTVPRSPRELKKLERQFASLPDDLKAQVMGEIMKANQ